MFSKLTMIALIITVGLILTVVAAAQTTRFTYQGRFTDSTMPQPTNGSYDMNFVAFDAVTGGNQFNQSVILSGVQITNGIFTVTLNFGETAFHGADVFVEISARPAGSSDPLTKLSPRQQITSAPYAVQSLNAKNANDSANLGGLPANAFVKADDSRLTDARNPLSGSANYIQNTTAEQNSDFNISGTGSATVLNATTVNAVGVNVLGTVSATTVNATGQYDIRGQRVLDAPFQKNTTVGIQAGESLIASSFGNSIFGLYAGMKTGANNNTIMGVNAGHENTSGHENTFVGDAAGFDTTSGQGNTFLGSGTGGSNTTGDLNTAVGAYSKLSGADLSFATVIGAGATVSTSNTVMLGRTADTVIAPHTLQVNTLGAAGSTSLCRNAALQISTCTAGNRPADGDPSNPAEIDSLRLQVLDQSEQLKQQQIRMDGLQKLICGLSPQTDVCKETK